MADRIKAIVTSALALGALAIPGFEGLETALGGPDSIVQAALGGYALYHTIALAVDWAHGNAAKLAGTGMLVFALILPVGAQAQAPDPDRGGVLVDYAIGHVQPQDGRVRFEVDVRLGSTPVLLVGHVLDGGAGVGPRVQHNIGPIVLYGHTLFGDWSTGAAADTASKLKHGGGVEVPIKDGLILRIGVESTPHPDGTMRASTVGVGWRF